MDIAAGVGVNLLAAALAVVAARPLLRAPRWVGRCAAVVAVAGIALFCLAGEERLWLARVLPFSGVLFAGNPTLPLASVLAVVGWRETEGTPRRRSVVPATLMLAALLFLLQPLLERYRGPTQPDAWCEDVCIQTSEVTCSAAAAATLLRSAGIDAHEAEMIRLCLTTNRGTSMLGVYRGLRHKTRNTDLHVRIPGRTLDELRAALEDGPVLLSVGIPRGGVEDERYERDWGWEPGVRHAVICFRCTAQGRAQMGDPSVGREVWDEEGLRVLWRGPALQLVQR